MKRGRTEDHYDEDDDDDDDDDDEEEEEEEKRHQHQHQQKEDEDEEKEQQRQEEEGRGRRRRRQRLRKSPPSDPSAKENDDDKGGHVNDDEYDDDDKDDDEDEDEYDEYGFRRVENTPNRIGMRSYRYASSSYPSSSYPSSSSSSSLHSSYSSSRVLRSIVSSRMSGSGRRDDKYEAKEEKEDDVEWFFRNVWQNRPALFRRKDRLCRHGRTPGLTPTDGRIDYDDDDGDGDGDGDADPLQDVIGMGWDGAASLLQNSRLRFPPPASTFSSSENDSDRLDDDDDDDDDDDEEEEEDNDDEKEDGQDDVNVPESDSARPRRRLRPPPAVAAAAAAAAAPTASSYSPPLFFKNQRPISPSHSLSLYSNNPFSAYLDGCSIVINHADAYLSGPIASMCLDLQSNFPHVYANAYVTPPNSAAVPAHADDRDVLVVQIAGQKVWKVYDIVPVPFPYENEQVGKGTLAVPTKVLDGPLVSLLHENDDDGCVHDHDHDHGGSCNHQIGKAKCKDDETKTGREVTLEPGDVLYMPRGYVHEARCGDVHRKNKGGNENVNHIDNGADGGGDSDNDNDAKEPEASFHVTFAIPTHDWSLAAVLPRLIRTHLSTLVDHRRAVDVGIVVPMDREFRSHGCRNRQQRQIQRQQLKQSGKGGGDGGRRINGNKDIASSNGCVDNRKKKSGHVKIRSERRRHDEDDDDDDDDDNVDNDDNDEALKELQLRIDDAFRSAKECITGRAVTDFLRSAARAHGDNAIKPRLHAMSSWPKAATRAKADRADDANVASAALDVDVEKETTKTSASSKTDAYAVVGPEAAATVTLSTPIRAATAEERESIRWPTCSGQGRRGLAVRDDGRSGDSLMMALARLKLGRGGGGGKSGDGVDRCGGLCEEDGVSVVRVRDIRSISTTGGGGKMEDGDGMGDDDQDENDDDKNDEESSRMKQLRSKGGSGASTTTTSASTTSTKKQKQKKIQPTGCDDLTLLAFARCCVEMGALAVVI